MTVAAHSLEKTGFVDVCGGKIHYRVYEPHDTAKSSNIPMLVVHGGPGASHSLLYDYLGSLADERPVVFYDQLGSHFSPAIMSPELMNLERFSDEVGKLIDYLHYEKVILFGHSWGGAIAVHFASMQKSFLKGLILSSPLISSKIWLDDCKRLMTQLPEKDGETINRCMSSGCFDGEYAKSEKLFSLMFFCRSADNSEPLKKHRIKTNKSIYWEMWGNSEFCCTGVLQNLDLFSLLPMISVPTQILCGEYDTATPETMKIAQAKIRLSRLSIVPKSGHLAFVDGTEQYLSVVKEFLESCEAAS
ncbi:MAG: proline iminopeptidase-family hydrolase [Alphaproteobacteria bacterium]|nr:proline iminopeptidase-family hydrolase [Alphaproteobacteria bacterium]